MEIEFTDTPPNGMSYQEWFNECCCACYGCPDCNHQCNRSEEERARQIDLFSNPDNWKPVSGEVRFRKLIIPTILNHIEYPADLDVRPQ